MVMLGNVAVLGSCALLAAAAPAGAEAMRSYSDDLVTFLPLFGDLRNETFKTYSGLLEVPIQKNRRSSTQANDSLSVSRVAA